MNFIDAMLILGAIAITAVVFIWVYRRRRPVAMEVVPQGQAPYYYPYTPGIQIVETNSGFTEGLIIGSAMQAGAAPQTIVNETVINETVVNETVIEEAPATFTAFSGGDTGGGGASASWADSEIDTFDSDTQTDSGPDSSSSDYSGDSSDSSDSSDN